MPQIGKSIEMYLMDGTQEGRWQAKLANWNGIAYKVGHESISKCNGMKMLHAPGVYFLFGRNDDTGRNYVYIGEGEDVITRIPQGHTFDKDDIYWKDAIIFVTPDESLDKSKVRYLESRFYELATETGRFDVLNKKKPQQSPLSRVAQDSMEVFIENAKLVVFSLGYSVFVPLPNSVADFSGIDIYTYSFGKDKEFMASGAFKDDQFWLLKGSYIAPDYADYVSKGVKSLRNEYESQINKKRILQVDIPFGSTSTALSFVTGKSINGLDAWINKDGLTINQQNGGAKKARTTASADGQPEAATPKPKKSWEVVVDLDTQDAVRLHLASKRLTAYAYKLSEGFLVKKGSQMNSEDAQSCSDNERAVRDELVSEGVVKDWVFTQDVLFYSASRATICIEGHSASSNEVWRDDNGTKLGKL